ncbi:unnamed protein product, partial [Oppiella nova]
MGNKISCCKANSPQTHRKKHHSEAHHVVIDDNHLNDRVGPNLQHISEREPEDNETDPSSHPTAGPLFMQRSRSDIRCHRKSQINLLESRPLKKSSSCSTIYLDDSTVSHPNLKNTIK